ncbi:MAG: BtpA/SgcQ family protein [Tepidisphaeraceae bacterium]
MASDKRKVVESKKLQVVGMVHLLPLPGAPGYGGNLAKIRDNALRDADALQAGGVDAIMIENFGDIPFFKTHVPTETVAHMTALALEVRKRVTVPIGINCLRNDGVSALSIAHAVGASFVRVNVLTGARVTDQGVIEGIAAELIRLRTTLGAKGIKVWADVDVKHSAPLAERPIEEEVWDMLERGGAEALIVSGTGTGKPTDPAMARRVKSAAPEAPLYVGSGVTLESLGEFQGVVDGVIVGTYFKKAGRVENAVDVGRVKAFMKQA